MKEAKTPKFSVGEIVWIRYHASAERNGFPTVGSPFEIDCKIIRSFPDANGDAYYELISGRGEIISISEAYLVNNKELFKLKYSYSLSLKENTFGLEKGEMFFVIDDWVVNEKLGIFFEKTYFDSTIKHLFDVVPRASGRDHKR